MIVGRDKSNVMRMIMTMRVARDGSSMVMKDTFSSVTLVEGDAYEERVGEMESCGIGIVKGSGKFIEYICRF